MPVHSPRLYLRLGDNRREREKEKSTEEKPRQNKTEQRARKLTFKERKELEALTAEIDNLTAEKAGIDARFASGEVLDDVAALSARYAEISRQLDEKEMRWLELSEIEG